MIIEYQGLFLYCTLMKRLLAFLCVTTFLIGCFEEPAEDPKPDRNKFFGNYDFSLSCEDGTSSNHILFIEKPIGNSDSISTLVILRNLQNKNETVAAIISQYDFILFDDTIIGTGTLNEDEDQFSISFSINDSTNCSGNGVRRL